MIFSFLNMALNGLRNPFEQAFSKDSLLQTNEIQVCAYIAYNGLCKALVRVNGVTRMVSVGELIAGRKISALTPREVIFEQQELQQTLCLDDANKGE